MSNLRSAALMVDSVLSRRRKVVSIAMRASTDGSTSDPPSSRCCDT